MSGNRGLGRPKGTPNKTTVLIKSAIEDAYAHLQKDPNRNLRTWAEDNTDLFYTVLMPKLLPLQVRHSGEVRAVYEIVAPQPARTLDEWTDSVRHLEN